MKIGFIDYYLDEWHANHYPAWLKEADGDMEVAYGYAVLDNPNGRTTAQWCADNGVEPCATMEELVGKADVLAVLAPDNTELHEALCQVALRCGKPTFIDKTFAPDGEVGRRIFELANRHGTPCWSASALRFATEYGGIDRGQVEGVVSLGPAGADTYSIHQLEPVVMLMQEPARRVMAMPGQKLYTVTMEFASGRLGVINGLAEGSPFMLHLALKGGNRVVEAKGDYFQGFIREMARFYRTGEAPVRQEETLWIADTRAAVMRALGTPGQWVNV
ncbi:Gfo/Idh/MocA family oxidoreductase [Acutalibacter caecimuris]|uniref:Gfo/Idh/MocA family oxidoreductase n=1 Tax=Acutalibacter caecimuris TaxID=3093657 RepID=UPI002AC987BA|nr:Gfo/Idh/MocA family oxidoreductase [Acutalibacter sp. M00118]